MPPTLSILRASDFGDFEPELKRAFRKAFHFEWDAEVDAPDAQARREAFARFINAARPPPDAQPTKGLELMRQCYELDLRISDFLRPDDALRDELTGKIGADLSSVGEQIAQLPRSGWTVSLEPSDVPAFRSADELQRAWRIIEKQLLERTYEKYLSTPADEIARLRKVASRARAQVDLTRRAMTKVTLDAKNDITASERAEMISALGTSLEDVSEKLAKFCGNCVAPPAHDAMFYQYLERVSRALPVQTNYGTIPSNQRCWTEVPGGALIMHRELRERRAAVLQGLCASDPAFFPLLPSTVRRDHRGPAIRGGKNNPNWVLRGITAALVLLELVDRPLDKRNGNGRELFETIVNQVTSWIRSEAASGFFFVDADASEPRVPGERPRSLVGVPLIARYTMSSADEPEQATHEKDVGA
jgi:hypothetical protein